MRETGNPVWLSVYYAKVTGVATYNSMLGHAVTVIPSEAGIARYIDAYDGLTKEMAQSTFDIAVPLNGGEGIVFYTKN
jgi:hypothetical protein